MPTSDMTNLKLSKIVSMEVLMSILATVFIVGVTWSSLAKDVESAESQIGKVESAQLDLEQSVQSIEVDIAVVKTTQSQIRHELKEQSDDISEVLRLLRQHPPGAGPYTGGTNGNNGNGTSRDYYPRD